MILLQYLNITEDTKLIDLSNRVGDRNVEPLLALNNLSRTVHVGKAWQSECDKIIESTPSRVSASRKEVLLNRLASDSDVFELACCLDENDWKILNVLNTLPSTLLVPDTIRLPDAYDVLGNGVSVGSRIYDNIMSQLHRDSPLDRITDLSVFNEISNIRNVTLTDRQISEPGFLSQWFKLPWGEVTLYSSIADDVIDFPVYPEEFNDGVIANFGTMSDMIYQYEPWQVYESSGPRSLTLTFKMHRHLWTGDHKDGKANELIRFCQANCYPQYNGSLVHVGTVSFYLAGSCLITGVLKKADVTWSGPLADDGFYLFFDLQLTIEEVSKQALNFNTVRNLPLIG